MGAVGETSSHSARPSVNAGFIQGSLSAISPITFTTGSSVMDKNDLRAVNGDVARFMADRASRVNTRASPEAIARERV